MRLSHMRYSISTKALVLRRVTSLAGLILLTLASVMLGYFMGPSNLILMIAAVGAVSIIVLLLVMSSKVGIQCIFYFIGIEGFLKVLSNYNPLVHIGSDLLLGLFTLRAILAQLIQRGIYLNRYPPCTLVILFHVIWFAISYFNPYALSIEATTASLKMYITMIPLFYFAYYLINKKEDVEFFMIPWVIIAFAQGVTSIHQGIMGPESVLSLGSGFGKVWNVEKYAGQAFRPFGLSSLPGGSSVYMFLGIGFLIVLYLVSRSYFQKLFLIVTFALTPLVLLMSQVRSALLKALIICGILLATGIAFFKRLSVRVRFNFGTIIAFTGVLILFVIPLLIVKVVGTSDEVGRAVERTLTLFEFGKVSEARGGALEGILRVVSIAPFGAGLSRTGPAAGKFFNEITENPFFKEGFWADNFWYIVLVDLGIPGALIMTWLISVIIWKGFTSLPRFYDSELQLYQAAIMASQFAMFTGLYGAVDILYNPEAAFFWFFAGASFRLPEMDRQIHDEYLRSIKSAI